jgi:hypothetical protein
VINLGSLQREVRTLTNELQDADQEFNKEATLAHRALTTKMLDAIEGTLTPHDRSTPTRSIFSVPWSRNDKFYGRASELNELRENLSPSDAAQRSCVLHGMAGIGKSQTALEFAYRSTDIFSHIFWVPAQDETMLAEAMGKICQRLGLDDRAAQPVDLARQVESALAWLCQSKSK